MGKIKILNRGCNKNHFPLRDSFFLTLQYSGASVHHMASPPSQGRARDLHWPVREPSFPETVTNDANWNNPPRETRDDTGAVEAGFSSSEIKSWKYHVNLAPLRTTFLSFGVKGLLKSETNGMKTEMKNENTSWALHSAGSIFSYMNQ